MSCDVHPLCVGCPLLEYGVGCKPQGELARVPKRYKTKEQREKLFERMGCLRADLTGRISYIASDSDIKLVKTDCQDVKLTPEMREAVKRRVGMMAEQMVSEPWPHCLKRFIKTPEEFLK